MGFEPGDRVWVHYNYARDGRRGTIVKFDEHTRYGYSVLLDDWKNSPISYSDGKPWWFNDNELRPMNALDQMAEIK